MNRYGFGTILGTIVLALGTGCAPVQTKAPARVIDRVVYVPIPNTLTNPLPVYERKAETFGEAWIQAETCTATLRQCNADRAAAASIEGTERQE